MVDKTLTPIVTAVIRTYNRQSLVSRAIESILAQTFKDYELIILDDCSTDSTEEVVRSYTKLDSRIRYIRQETPVKNVKALNMANRMARGKYVAYLDDDDTWRPRKLELQVNRFESGSERIGLVTGGVQYWKNDNREGLNYQNVGNSYKLRLWIPRMRGDIYWKTLGGSGNIFGPPSVVMIRKDVLDEIGYFREDMPRGACQQLFRRIAKKYEIDFVTEIVLDYYYHKNTIGSILGRDDVLKCIKSYQVKIESTKDDLEQVPAVYAGELVKLGFSYFLDGQYANAWGVFQKAAELNDSSAHLQMCRAFASKIRMRVGASCVGPFMRNVRRTLKRTCSKKSE